MYDFLVIHVRLSDRHAFEINARGWDCDPGYAYMCATQKQEYSRAFNEGMLEDAAVVRAEDLDEVFHDTNHIDTDWTENFSVLWNCDRPRSTCVGDIIINIDTEEVFSVADFGFSDVSGLSDKFLKLAISRGKSKADAAPIF